MDSTNNRIGSIRFDNETILEVSQKGGGGAGVGGTGGLEARNLITGESTNEAIEDLTEDLEAAQETIETQAQTIEDQAGTIESQAQTIEDQQAVIDAFPTIEALNVTSNGTYNETGKAYKPVTVNVPSLTLGAFGMKIVNNTADDFYIAGFNYIDNSTPHKCYFVCSHIDTSGIDLSNFKFIKSSDLGELRFLLQAPNITNITLTLAADCTEAYSNITIVQDQGAAKIIKVDIDISKDFSKLSFIIS